MIKRILPIIFVITIGLMDARQAFAETGQIEAETLKNLVHDVVSHDVGNFVEQFYPAAKSRLFVYLNDEDWAIERLQTGVYLISVHIEAYPKSGANPLGRDILTIKIDPNELNHFFANPHLNKSDGHGIHIVQCEHQNPEIRHHEMFFSPPKEVHGKFCG